LKDGLKNPHNAGVQILMMAVDAQVDKSNDDLAPDLSLSSETTTTTTTKEEEKSNALVTGLAIGGSLIGVALLFGGYFRMIRR
jgi:hypothetical protein